MPNTPYAETLQLYSTLIDVYYVLLALDIRVIKPLSIRFKGKELKIPTDLALFAKAVNEAEKYLRHVERIIISPSRILEEETSIGNIIEGPINIPLSSQYIGRGIQLVAYNKRKLTFASPENLLLKAFYLRLYKDIERLKKNLENILEEQNKILELHAKKLIKDIDAFTRRLKRLRRLSILKEIIIEPKLTKCNELKRLAKIVLRRKHRLYHKIAQQSLEYCTHIPRIDLVSRSIKENIIEGRRLGLWDYKLYEVYLYYLAATILVKTLRPRDVYLSNRTLIYKSDNKDYLLLYDEPVKCNSWLGHGRLLLDSSLIREVSPGRPDISLVKIENKEGYVGKSSVLVVMDAKYTTNYSYVLQSRYKILGYLNEYDSRIGALIFSPSKLESREVQDQEDIEFEKILIEVIDKDGGKIVDSMYKLYLIPLDPKPYEEVISGNNYQLLIEAFKESLKT